jgi:hypothetical protein
MFIGHFALAFAAKRAAPRTSLGTTFVAAQLADLVWPILLLVGVEQVRITPNETPFLNLTFTNYPWSHSLVTEVAAGALLGGLYFLSTRYARGAITLGLLVPSHWLLDLFVHVPDLPIYPGGASRLGFGLWSNPIATVIVEVALFALGVAIYAATTHPRDRRGKYGLWALVIFLLILYVVSCVSPPPPSVTALAWAAMIGWPLTLWPWWVDRHRDGTQHASSGASTASSPDGAVVS